MLNKGRMNEERRGIVLRAGTYVLDYYVPADTEHSESV